METQVFHPQETCFLLLASAAPFKGELLQSNGQAKVVQGLLGGFHPGCFPKSWVMSCADFGATSAADFKR